MDRDEICEKLEELRQYVLENEQASAMIDELIMAVRGL